MQNFDDLEGQEEEKKQEKKEEEVDGFVVLNNDGEPMEVDTTPGSN